MVSSVALGVARETALLADPRSVAADAGPVAESTHVAAVEVPAVGRGRACKVQHEAAEPCLLAESVDRHIDGSSMADILADQVAAEVELGKSPLAGHIHLDTTNGDCLVDIAVVAGEQKVEAVRLQCM